jgi:ATP adenylyltransferase
MDKLYAPWRDRYVHQVAKGVKAEQCVFCDIFTPQESDQDKLVLWKNDTLAVILNLYPYNGGHVMVIPKNHVAEFYHLSSSELATFMNVLAFSTKALTQALACEGINVGANLGRAAGAGIPQHVHMHVVPRFAGDTGFFTTVGDAKQISVDLEKIYKKLKPFFDQFSG